MGVLKIAGGILLAFFIIVVLVLIIVYSLATQEKEKQIKAAEEYTKRSYESNNYSYTKCEWSDSQNKVVCNYALKEDELIE